MAHLERRKKLDIIPIFINYLKQSGINIVETTWEDVTNSLKLLQNLGLSYKLWDDAIIFNQMGRVGIEFIYSNDTDFDLLHAKREF